MTLEAGTLIAIAVSAFGTLAIVFVTVYLQFIKPWSQQPRFRIEFDMGEPYCRKTSVDVKLDNERTYTTEAYWLRIRVRNLGKSVAKRCIGKLVVVMDRDGNRIERYDPVTLKWVGTDEDAVPLWPIDLNPEEYEYLDVLSTRYDVKNWAYIMTDRMRRGIPKVLSPGSYILHITIYGDGVSPESKYFSVHWLGQSFTSILIAMHNTVQQARSYIRELIDQAKIPT